MSKVCIGCKQTKTYCEFTNDKSRKGGLNSTCKECKKTYNKKYNIDNKIEISKKQKEYNKKIEVKQKNKQYKIKYEEKNKDKIKVKRKEYNKQNQKNLLKDPIKNLQHRMRCVIGQCIKRLNNNKKSQNTLSTVGLESWVLFKKHIESQFTEGMNWSNHGHGKNNTTWHIDHIIPLSSAVTEEDVYRLNHYTNLRPMWGSDNIRKSNKHL
jgi:hypothetical protein